MAVALPGSLFGYFTGMAGLGSSLRDFPHHYRFLADLLATLLANKRTPGLHRTPAHHEKLKTNEVVFNYFFFLAAGFLAAGFFAAFFLAAILHTSFSG